MISRVPSVTQAGERNWSFMYDRPRRPEGNASRSADIERDRMARSIPADLLRGTRVDLYV